MQRYLYTRIAADIRYRQLTRGRVNATAGAIAAVLGEPQLTAARIARASYVQNLAFEADYDWLARARLDVAAERLASIDFSRADELASALHRRRQPLLIATLHMGHYVSAMLRCVAHIPDLRDLAVIKRAAHSEQEDMAYRHLTAGVRLQILRLDQRPLRRALAALHSGAALLTMIDVPPTFGVLKTQATQWFGHPAHLPVGPANIAVAAGALVLPMTTWSADGRDVLTCGPFIDARPCNGEARSAAITRVHEALAAQSATWIRAQPQAWMLWGHVAAFFNAA